MPTRVPFSFIVAEHLATATSTDRKSHVVEWLKNASRAENFWLLVPRLQFHDLFVTFTTLHERSVSHLRITVAGIRDCYVCCEMLTIRWIFGVEIMQMSILNKIWIVMSCKLKPCRTKKFTLQPLKTLEESNLAVCDFELSWLFQKPTA